MKIMRAESCCDGWVRRAGGINMGQGLDQSSRAPFGTRATRQERFPMQWQTPTATDFRFGFEITMYVANR